MVTIVVAAAMGLVGGIASHIAQRHTWQKFSMETRDVGPRKAFMPAEQCKAVGGYGWQGWPNQSFVPCSDAWGGSLSYQLAPDGPQTVVVTNMDPVPCAAMGGDPQMFSVPGTYSYTPSCGFKAFVKR